MIVLSLLWSAIVGFLGLEEERPWGSFFLQYLWEFGLGMWIADRIFEREYKMVEIKEMRWYWLMAGAIGGMGLSALMAWNGGWLKLYNDIPSLMGYLSVALLIYKIDVRLVNRFFEWANGFSYELYLVHSLVYAIVAYMITGKIPFYLMLIISFVTAYVASYVYCLFTKRIIIAK